MEIFLTSGNSLILFWRTFNKKISPKFKFQLCNFKPKIRIPILHSPLFVLNLRASIKGCVMHDPFFAENNYHIGLCGALQAARRVARPLRSITVAGGDPN